MTEQLSTRRLIIRRFTAADLEDFCAYQADPQVRKFHPGFHRQGYGREAMTAFLVHLFEELGLERVTAGCDQANSASRGLLVRLGLRPQTPAETDGSCQFELTRDEWSAQRA